MPHLVTFTSVEGKKGYHHCEELGDAVRFVERLRNNEGVSDAQVFRMEEVPLEVKTYFRVEVAGASPAPASPAPASPAPAPAAPPAMDATAEPAMVAMTPPPAADPGGEGRPTFSIFSK